MKKIPLLLVIIIVIAFVLVKTNPSNKYHRYLNEVHGVMCQPNTNNSCFHRTSDMYNEGIKDYGLFMVAKTNIFDEPSNYIRVLGILGHFFVMENNLNGH
ncbi:hypothetical protein MJA45_21620 [Paenibacillus aurantius]|uniref:Uncharacterized protein n=1 Tax=Paenibacillus aurantius TaxID=2918900 RepID=A0AA96REH9_9BACL|nr:hypothetical protein [Paenibacillus aurantius]WNQ10198.1 hypothetical protein MJA45_21620 [Paenibacillus aurantius]